MLNARNLRKYLGFFVCIKKFCILAETLTLRKMKKTILEKLDERNVCYAVGRSHLKLGSESYPYYYVIVNAADRKKVSNLGFKSNKDKDANGLPYYVIERDMTEEDLKWFKDNIEKYHIVKQDEAGRIYELIENGFQSHYQKTKNRMIECYDLLDRLRALRSDFKEKKDYYPLKEFRSINSQIRKVANRTA